MKKETIKHLIKNVIYNEIEALKKLKQSISKSSFEVVKLILNCKNGKVIISGVGKSGIIARKWAATLSSTGTPSFFMDASNASHGDMGQITSNDIVVLISNSGESDELKNIIQFTSRNRNIKLIGITSNKNSTLYKNSDVAVLIPKIKEAGPENIVPTSSTIAQLSLGDSIAIACMKSRNFNRNDFKKFHPSGALSVKLKTVNDLMLTGKKIPFVAEEIKMSKIFKKINDKKLGILISRNKKKVTTGIITDGDIKRIAQRYENFRDLKLKKVINKSPISVDINTLAARALALMNSKKITSLCVHKNKKVNKTIGIIHIHDILKSNIS